MSSGEKEIHDPDGRIEHPGVHYEEKDVRFGCILALLIVAGCVLVVLFSTVWQLFRAEQRSQAENKESLYPLAPASSPPLPPEPRLEQIDRMPPRPAESEAERLAEMERLLHTSGPTAEKGFVHIPIEEAMKKIVDRLPVRKEPPGSDTDRGTDRGLLDSGASNSGRMFRGGPQ